MTMVFWNAMSCSFVDGYQRFGGPDAFIFMKEKKRW